MGVRLHVSIPNDNGFVVVNNNKHYVSRLLELGKISHSNEWEYFFNKWIGYNGGSAMVHYDDLAEMLYELKTINDSTLDLYNIDILDKIIDYATQRGLLVYLEEF